MLYLIRPVERRARRDLRSEADRQRFDRAKRFVDAAVARGGPAGYRLHARWLKFLCSSPAVQRDIYSEECALLREFAAAFGLSSEETRKFVGLSLLGRIWTVWSLTELYTGPKKFLAKLTDVKGWEQFERGMQEGHGFVLLPVHVQFSRLFQPYLRHRGYDGWVLGDTNDRLEQRGIKTPMAKRFEHAKQLLQARQTLKRGGLVYNLPDARQNLDNSRTVDFFGRQRQIAAGFAELALESGAHVAAISYRFTLRGTFIMEISEPFRVPGSASKHEQCVESLVNQYADFLRDQWRRYPWNFQWNHLRYYLGLPEVADEGDDAEPLGTGLSLESVERSA